MSYCRPSTIRELVEDMVINLVSTFYCLLYKAENFKSCLSVCLSICLSVCLSVWLYVGTFWLANNSEVVASIETGLPRNKSWIIEFILANLSKQPLINTSTQKHKCRSKSH